MLAGVTRVLSLSPNRPLFPVLVTIALLVCLPANAQDASSQKQAAQAPAAQKPDSTPPVIKVASRVLEVSVLVHDKDGNPVTNLKQRDFTLYDDRQRERIQFFNVINGTLANAPPAKIPAGYFTNDPTQNAKIPGNLVIILLDALNTPFLEQPYVNRQLWAYLRQLNPQDHVAVYTLGDKLQVLQDFTTDDEVLVRAVQAYHGQRIALQDGADPLSKTVGPISPNVSLAENGPAITSLPASTVRGQDSAASRLNQLLMKLVHLDEDMIQSYTVNRVDVTLSAFRGIAAHVAGVPGRKNLIWLSGSFPLAIGIDRITERGPDQHIDSTVTRFSELEETVRSLDDANVAVYPVDTHGLVAPDLNTLPYLRAAGGDPAGAPSDTDTHLTMDQVAKRTGGMAFYNSNGIERSITRAAEDSRSSYVLGYALTATDRKFHTLRVAVDRDGVTVRSRQGYFAIPAAQYSQQQQEYLVEQAEASPLDMTEIPMIVQARLKAGAGDSASRDVSVSVFAYGTRIQFAPDGQNEIATVDYIAVQRGDQGQILKYSGQIYHLRLTPTLYRQALHGGITYKTTVSLDPRSTELRVVTRDAGSGALGSVTFRVAEIPHAAVPASTTSVPK